MWTTRRVALAIFVFLFAVYFAPTMYDLVHKPFFGWALGQDVTSASILPIPILQHGDFTLDEYHDFFWQYWHSPYFVAEVNGHLVSRYPVVAAVLAVPFYGVPLGTGWLAHPPYAWLSFPWSAFFPAKAAAAFITALAGVMFFFCARELADLKSSASLAIVFGLGTSVWSTASQALWQHTPSILFLLIGIWFLLRGRNLGATAVAPAAFFFSAATVSRANNGIAALLFTVYVLIEYRSAFWRWVAWAIPPVLLAFVYNTIYNGSPLVFGYQEGFSQVMALPRLESVLGIFISPSRGLFVYSPFLLFAFAGIWQSRHEKESRFYLFSAAAFGLSAFLVTLFIAWDGGWGYGTRLLVDAMPFAVLLLIPVFVRLKGAARFSFWVAVGFAIVLQSFGLWDYGERWHWHWDNNYSFDVWNLTENEPLFYLKQYVTMGIHFASRLLPK